MKVKRRRRKVRARTSEFDNPSTIYPRIDFYDTYILGGF